MSARTVLVISYHFAPSAAVGAKRFSFLAREFAHQGYDVHVIANETAESPVGAADASLPLAAAVHRVPAAFHLPRRGRGFFDRAANAVFRRALAPVGWEYFWADAAERKALEVARNLAPGIVIATSPPHAAMIAGARVARKLGWPLVLDYRDPWSAYDWPRWRRGSIAQAVSRRIEARLIRKSAARVLNTPAMRQWFERVFPEASNSRNFVIPNGFDPLPRHGAPPAEGPITLLHAGEIYTGRSLVPILRAVRNASLRNPNRPIRVVTFGDLPPREWERIRAGRYEPFIEVRPRVPFAELSAELERAHLLLAVVGDHMLYSTPYKVYDYMAVGRPVLGLAPRGASLFELLAESGAGICVAPDDEAGIETALDELLVMGASDAARIRTERYRWQNLAREYGAVLEAVAGRESLLIREKIIVESPPAAFGDAPPRPR